MAVKKCAICKEAIEEEFGKLKGTIIKAKNEKGINDFIPVCNQCQKKEKWIEEAKIKGV
ncbi:hypothetical protein GOV14_05605 [Candidatus Pacearchaeota archaeon]|nr:hypothetical protein [Candidatus Pacearchaeota archaeon]